MSSVSNMSNIIIPTVTCASGVKMPKFIYGTAWKKERTTELVNLAIQAGFRAIDTACQPKHYSEARVGQSVTEAFKQSHIQRKDLFIQTKFTPIGGQDRSQPLPYDPTESLENQVLQSFKTSQQNLQLEIIDSLVLHSPLAKHEQTMQVWRAFEALHSKGLVRQLGISNIYDVKQLANIINEAQVKPSIIQNRFYEDSHFDIQLRALCRKHGIIYTSFWTLTANPHYLKSPLVTTLAKQYQKTPSQIWFRFVLHLGIVPLTGTSSLQHMQQDLEVFTFQLTLPEVQELGKLIGENDIDELRDL